MKEFNAQTGGRYTYVDDIINLQELALAFTSLFTDCDNFIISGCEVTGSTISAGFVYLNGKLRRFSGATGIGTWPQYIYESNKTESVAYASGADKVGRNDYGCTIGSSVPTTPDALTNAVPAYIQIPKSGGKRLKEAFFGKYALLLDSIYGSQSINGDVTFRNNVNVNSVLTTNKNHVFKNGESVCQMFWEGRLFNINARIGNGTSYNFRMDDSTEAFVFSIGGVDVCTISKNGVNFLPIKSSSTTSGNVTSNTDQIYNSGSASDDGTLYINYKGYNDSVNYFRNTVIGNGKGNAVVKVVGSSGLVGIYGNLNIASSMKDGITLKHNTAQKSSVGLTKVISWCDMSDAKIAYIGFNSAADNVFYINNVLSDVEIEGVTAVNLGPIIKENGVALKDKYVLKEDLASLLGGKADTSKIYTNTDVDKNFAKLANGLSQFVNTTNTKEVLRKQIGAIAIGELDSYVRLDKFLADMAKTEAEKEKICENIGAARSGDFQSKIPDTGWIQIGGTNLYARQIGNHVCVQGKVVTVHTGNTVFTLPNQIAPPKYDVAFRAIMDCNHNWGCVIHGGSKECKVVCCDHCGKNISVSFSYMV